MMANSWTLTQSQSPAFTAHRKRGSFATFWGEAESLKAGG